MSAALRVLIAEDEPTTAIVLQELVEQDGHTICAVIPSGEGVLDAVLALRPDVVLMDVHLAGAVSGIEATRRILENVTVPVLIISGTDSPDEMKAIARSGALGFIKKPISASNLKVNLNLAAHQNDILMRLRASESLHRNIFDNAAVGIYVCHPGGRYLACNQAFAHILGYAGSGELLHTVSSLDEQVYTEPGRRQELLGMLRSGREVRDFESRVYGRDGEYVWISEYLTPSLGADGELQYYEGVAINITERVRAREAEALALSLAQTTVEAMADFVAVTDLDRNIIIANRAFEEAIGVHLGADRVLCHAAGTPDLFAAFLAGIDQEAENTAKAQGTLHIPHVPLSLDATITPYRTAEGAVVGAVFVMRPQGNS